MRIIVTHDGKQHVNHLLLALVNRGWLVRFYTQFHSNLYLPYVSQVGWLKKQFRNHMLRGIAKGFVRSLPVAFLVNRLMTAERLKIHWSFRLFDRWVANSIRNETFDLLIGYENSNMHSFEAAKQLKKITVLDLAHIHHEQSVMIRQQYTPEKIIAGDIIYINQRKQTALDLSDYFFTLSSFASNSLKQYNVDPVRIFELNLGVDTNFFRPVLRPSGPFRILYVGAVNHAKGIVVLLSAFQNLDLPDAQLTFVGPVGDGLDLLSPWTGTDKIRHVPFLHHDELVAYYQQADVFVFPSYLDSWGQVVLEAMACGTPVIVTENTGAKDAVEKGGGFVIPVGDALALAEKIQYFYDNRTEIERMGCEARRVAEQYTWENYYQQVTNALTDIARRERISTHSN
jgi:glycosyltransferase involved in cell wall biosynthesis